MGILSILLAGCVGERPENLGVINGRLAACPGSPNCVSSGAKDPRHAILPLTFAGDPRAAFARLKETLARRSDTAIVEEGPGYLRVEFRTRLFVDDGEFLLDRERPQIELRSASRLGYYDFGLNRRRIEAIRRDYR